jgi:DNA repair protein RadC
MESTNEKRLYQVAEIQLTYKSNVKPSLRPKISGSRDAFNILKENWDEGKIEFLEQFKAMFTNRANRVLGILDVSTGGVTGTVADPRVIFAAAIKVGACGLIVSHNHPSGKPAGKSIRYRTYKAAKRRWKVAGNPATRSHYPHNRGILFVRR